MIIDSRYKVIENLGSGLYANVYKVQDIRTGKIYSLKLFHRLEASSVYDELNAEAMHQITKLRHPNLLHIYSFGNMDTHIYYLAEYYQGKTLKNFRFSLSNCHVFYDLIAQICYALDALHNQNILHKDIKPENIMYQLTGDKIQVKVLDYGFSKIDTERNQQKISGTLPYIAPETYSGKGSSPESDFYALGVTLYFILTGTLPFSQDQIAEIIHGDHKNFFPKFIRTFIPDIPIELEKFILKLIEKKPEDRFSNCRSIIEYLNKIPGLNYPYSQKQSTINFFQFGSYLVRKDYAEQLRDYLVNMVHRNGKIITLIGGQGLGKGDLLTLFKYHILTNQYFIFDYTCSQTNRDPFFALIKEFSSSALNNERKNFEISGMSERFRRYLELSENVASKLNETEENLLQDYEHSLQFLKNLSEERPLVFVIRGGQYLTEQTIGFLNYISEEVIQLPILIVIAINDPGKIKSLKHAVRILVKTLTLNETHHYLNEIFKTDVPDYFSDTLWKRSNGNPKFIIEIMVDLIRKKKFLTTDKLEFNINFEEYQLPEELIHSIYNRMSHLSATSYRYLQKLSCIYTPLTMDLIMEILKISRKTLYNLLSDAQSNEMLFKDKGVYEFNFSEAKNRFFKECTEYVRIDISKQLIQYYKDNDNLDISVIQGLIKNCSLCKDYQSLVQFKRKLFQLYHNKYDQNNAFREIYEIVELDFSQKMSVTETEIRSDITWLIDKADLTGYIQEALELINTIPIKEDLFEVLYAKGTFNTRLEDWDKAEENYEKAQQIAITGKQQARVLLDFMWLHIVKGEKIKALQIIGQLERYQLTSELEITFYDRKGMYLSRYENEYEAIQFLENILLKIKQVTDQLALNRLASLYNNLGILYSGKKMYSETLKYFEQTLSIWEKLHNQRLLGTIYNNLGDFYLKQGYTQNALDYFKKAKEVSEKINNARGLILAYLNFGEAYIKLGDFISAEEFLNKARESSEKVKNKLFKQSILYNLCTAKSKLYNFRYYLDFLKNEKLFDELENIEIVNPFHKSYIYYLCEVNQTEKVNKILNNKINFSATSDEEFLHQITGILFYHKKEYLQAKLSYEKALTAANLIKSSYAIAICYIRLAQCNIKLHNILEAEENLKNANVFIETHRFQYWGVVQQMLKIELGLLKKEIPLRSLLRQANQLSKFCYENHYFILNIECMSVITQIYNELKANSSYKTSFSKYQSLVKEAVRKIPEEDQKSYLALKLPSMIPVKKLSFHMISNRHTKNSETWQEELFGLLRKDVINEIHFTLEKYIKETFAPHKFVIVYTKKNTPYENFLNFPNFISYISNHFKENELELYKSICVKALNNKQVVKTEIDNKHVMVAPLWLRLSCYGCLIIADDGELPFTTSETHAMKLFSTQLSALLIRIIEFETNEKKMKKMKDVMNLSRKFIQVYDIKRLEVDILLNAIHICNAKRGVLIKKDNSGNFLFHIAYDNERNIISSFPNVSKTALLYVQENKNAIYTANVLEENIFKSAPSILQYQINSLFCAPIIIDDEIYAYLYLDNYLSNHEKMYVDEEVNNMFLVQISLALQNALTYDALMKKNFQLRTLDNMKNEFIQIVSHELNTPLLTMQGYVNVLKKNVGVTGMQSNDLLQKIEKSTSKLRQTINDIMTLNRFNAANSLSLVKHNVSDILTTLVAEAEIASKNRKMRFKLEIGENLPEVMIDWTAFHLMVYNLVLNAIRFTSDFGTIIVGARLAAFQQEKVEDQDSLVIYVQDNGIGIPEHEQENVFKSFYELGDMLAHRSGNVEYRSSGLGLGLSLSKRIAELHKGKIWLRSKESEGTTVFVSIPFTTKNKNIELISTKVLSNPDKDGNF